jgi:hypothetical protein
VRIPGPPFVYATLLVAAGGIAGAGAASTSPQGFIDALIATSRHDSIPADMDIYAPVLGDWEITGTEQVTGPPKPVKMKVNFARTLDGRAIQDIWSWAIDPSRPATGANYAAGTTLRVYDPEQRVWRITWIDPVKRARVHLDAHRVGEDIVQIGSNAKGEPRRWIFSEITQDSFTWRGEGSEDGGQTWRLYAEYFARRRG